MAGTDVVSSDIGWFGVMCHESDKSPKQRTMPSKSVPQLPEVALMDWIYRRCAVFLFVPRILCRCKIPLFLFCD